MDDSIKKLLFDVMESGKSISEWCMGRTYSDYAKSKQLRRAVEREYTIVGEALNRLSRQDPTTAARIPDLPGIVGLRNVVIHEYEEVDDTALWGMTMKDLPGLLARVRSVLREEGEDF